MKDFIKKHSLLLAIIAAVAFLAVFLTFIFSKVGDSVYVIATNGTVNVGNADDVSSLKPVSAGMKLSTGDIIVTSDMSSCIVSYNKKATEKDNFINIGENSQMMIYDRNSQGGYKFFLTYGSVICNMPVEKSYRTNISAKTFNVFADGTITKITYDNKEDMGKVYTFDGNPRLQIIQPSGTTNAAEKLLKNSVCAVSKMDDGTIGFGCLNVGFSLNAFTAQDLKVMSGVANTWSEKISFGSNEFEQAFQTASDYAKWVVTDPVTIDIPETEIPINSDTFTSDVTNIISVSSETTVDTTIEETGSVTSLETKRTAATQTIPDAFRDDYYDSPYENDSDMPSVSGSSTAPSYPITAFSRETLYDLDNGNKDVSLVTTVPADKQSGETSAAGTKSSRVTEPYKKDNESTVTAGTTVTTPSVTTSSSGKTTTYYTATSKTTGKPSYNTGIKPAATVDKTGYHTVIFSYSTDTNEYWSVQLVKDGQAAIAPSAPVVPGRRFVGWSHDYSKITSDTEITALFVSDDSTIGTSDTFKVKFYVNSKLWKTVSVRRGGSAKFNQVPDSGDKNLVFAGWSEDLSNIQSDMTVFAMFKTKS